MKKFTSRFIQSMPALLAIAASVGLLPGCADFWRVKQAVTTGATEPPDVARPPAKPDPEPSPQPSPPLPPPSPSPPKSAPGPRPTAVAVPGKTGFVFSPYNNKLIDVQGFASGTLVSDPTFPMSEKKFFRVP